MDYLLSHNTVDLRATKITYLGMAVDWLIQMQVLIIDRHLNFTLHFMYYD